MKIRHCSWKDNSLIAGAELETTITCLNQLSGTPSICIWRMGPIHHMWWGKTWGSPSRIQYISSCNLDRCRYPLACLGGPRTDNSSPLSVLFSDLNRTLKSEKNSDTTFIIKSLWVWSQDLNQLKKSNQPIKFLNFTRAMVHFDLGKESQYANHSKLKKKTRIFCTTPLNWKHA